jgi:hypothetical protein
LIPLAFLPPQAASDMVSGQTSADRIVKLGKELLYGGAT